MGKKLGGTRGHFAKGWRKKWREIAREKTFLIPAAAMRPPFSSLDDNPWERKDNWPKKRIAGSCPKRESFESAGK